MDQHGDGEAAEAGTAEFFRQHRRAEIVHLRAAIFGRIAQSQETQLAHLVQHLARHAALAFPGLAMGLDFFPDEPADLIAQERMLFAQIG